VLLAEASMIRRLALSFAFAASVCFACGGSSSTSLGDGDAGGAADGGGDAPAGGGDAASDGGPPHTSTHDCSPVCGSQRYCQEPLGPGICPMHMIDSGAFCPAGCIGCPPLPPPSCAALPAACNGTPSCDCLLTACPGGCGPTRGTCEVNADGDWVVGCLSC
jgi:hypothetical protein